MVIANPKKQDEFQAFYTNCNHITAYMVGLLDCENDMNVLEPCAGEGVFIDEIFKQGLDVQVSALELNSDSVSGLTKKYERTNSVSVEMTDYAFFENKISFDRVIANPPYGAYQSPEKRSLLKKKYPKIYAKETYGIFLLRAMEMLKANGKLVFIIPDTYLTLHMHEGLRHELLSKYQIESIALFPSNFFPGVNFGYAGLSIISIANKVPDSDWKFPVYGKMKHQSELVKLLTNSKKDYEIGELHYSQLLNYPSFSFFLPSEPWLTEVLGQNTLKIGEICDVVTGFYSGNDGEFLRRGSTVTRGLKKYQPVDESEIFEGDTIQDPPLEGVDGTKCWVPIVKGGNKRFYKPSEWFMNWSREAIHSYCVTNKKRARFQNSQFYFKQGIGVPMVSSSSITGSLIDNRLFDQSIVGIFPHQDRQNLLLFLLGFFNSKVCNELIRTINASTNNSSNYIKKIPIIIPELEVISKVELIVNSLVEISKDRELDDSDLIELNVIFDEIYGR